jgi:hypothetical protein
MRKVLYRSTAGTTLDKNGFFHGIGTSLVKINGAYYSVTVAIVETEEGELAKIDLEDVNFLTPPEE